jgi:hypothetical protein
LFNRAPVDASDPAAMAVLGRLLKERAREERDLGKQRELYRQAADAYRQGAEAHPSTYALINAATLFFLGGDVANSVRLARRVVALLAENPGEPETPYYGEATRSEALLLLDRAAEARSALCSALAAAPLAWEDHASTLRQFALILEAQERDASWLDLYRPPGSLHFGGHMSFSANGNQSLLRAEIDAILSLEKIGFGYGALAAGADIIVAEALLEHGAELHAVLPGGVEAFAAVSVDPFGPEWRRRFEAVLARAVEVRAVGPLRAPPDESSIALADEVAMGAAVMNARRLESRAVQLLVVADSASKRTRDAWAEAGWPQHLLTAPREDVSPGAAPAPSRGRRRLALLTVAPPSGTDFDAWLAQLRLALDAISRPTVGPYLEEGRAAFAYDTPLAAAQAAAPLRAALPELRIGGHYSAAETFHDPFSGGERVAADSGAAAAGALASTLPGTTYVTEDFAAALVASGRAAQRTEFIGELEAPDGGPPVGLHVLKS